MKYDFSNLKKRIIDIEEWLRKELSSIRTGRATVALLDGVLVESYGTKAPINQVANVAVEDARTLRISPWDTSLSKSIEKAIILKDLGVSVSVDDKGLRVSFPDVTTERRHALVKVVGEKIEEAKVSLRSEREEVWGDIQDREKKGEISEDEKFRLKEEMQKIIDDTNKKFDEMGERKEKDILSN